VDELADLQHAGKTLAPENRNQNGASEQQAQPAERKKDEQGGRHPVQDSLCQRKSMNHFTRARALCMSL
jgi:hypothetical protein